MNYLFLSAAFEYQELLAVREEVDEELIIGDLYEEEVIEY